MSSTVKGAILGGVHPNVRDAAKAILSDGQVQMTVGTAKEIIKRNALLQEWMRTKMDFNAAIAALDAIDSILEQQWKSLDRVQLAALKMRADIQMMKINKWLPDAKDATAILANQGDDGGDRPEWMTNMEQARERITNLIAEAVATNGEAEVSSKPE